jgi:hypothetical protein
LKWQGSGEAERGRGSGKVAEVSGFGRSAVKSRSSGGTERGHRSSGETERERKLERSEARARSRTRRSASAGSGETRPRQRAQVN